MRIISYCNILRQACYVHLANRYGFYRVFRTNLIGILEYNLPFLSSVSSLQLRGLPSDNLYFPFHFRTQSSSLDNPPDPDYFLPISSHPWFHPLWTNSKHSQVYSTPIQALTPLIPLSISESVLYSKFNDYIY